jgi:hypothetical protein
LTARGRRGESGAGFKDGSLDESPCFTAGVHLGRFLSPHVSLAAELRMQRWLSDAAPARNNPAAREQLTVGFGPRFHFRAFGRLVRPGVSYTRALDDPMAASGYDVLQLDVPVVF